MKHKKRFEVGIGEVDKILEHLICHKLRDPNTGGLDWNILIEQLKLKLWDDWKITWDNATPEIYEMQLVRWKMYDFSGTQ